jgi:hypothetical protein
MKKDFDMSFYEYGISALDIKKITIELRHFY